MNHQNNKRFIITFVILLFSIIILKYFYVPQNTDKNIVNLDKFPDRINEWQGRNIRLDWRTYEILNPDGILFKEYVNNKGEKVQLVIVLGLNKRESFHPPEVCYTGNGGFVDIEEQESIILNNNRLLKLNRLVVKNNHSTISQLVMYWFTANNKHYASYYRQQMAIVMNQLLYKNSWGSLIRVSTNKYGEENMDQANQRLERFIREMYPLLQGFIDPSHIEEQLL